MKDYLHLQKSPSLWLTINIFVYFFITNSPAKAQIIPDSTLPNNSVVIPAGNTDRIEGGTRAGNNLFHSFQEFSIPTGKEAFFNNTADIENILGRVTGGNISEIDGLIRANGTANLFLINPQGIVFGSNASLNLGGSFLGSTASSLQFDNGNQFSAINPQAPPLLTINFPLGLQFGQSPGSIINQSRAVDGNGQIVGLQVLPGRTIGLVGGNLNLAGGGLRAAQGRIELGSVGNNSLVSLTPNSEGFSLGYGEVENFSDLQLSQQAVVSTSGLGGGAIQVRGDGILLTEGSRVMADTFGNFNGKGIDIQANNFILQNQALISASTFGGGNGGGITIGSEAVQLQGSNPLEISRQLLVGTFNPFNLQEGLYSLSGGSGQAGDISINADRLIVKDGVGVMTTALADGAGGEINLNISQLAELTNGSLFITGNAGAGDAGDMNITTNQLRVLDGTALSTNPGPSGQGRGGDLTVNAQLVELRGTPTGAVVPGGLFTATLGAGDAGDLHLKTGELIVADGTQISASSAGAGQGGNLHINADQVAVSGISEDGRFLSGLFTSSSLLTVVGQRGTASAGNLNINTKRLRVENGAQISAATGGEGTAGSLIVKASELVEVTGFATEVNPAVESVSFGVVGDGIVPSAIESNTSGAGQAGDLEIQTRRLIVSNGAEIGVRGTSTGAAGDLEVLADSIELNQQGIISAATVSGTGGNISLQASDLKLRRNSRITTNAGNSNGGNISINTGTIVALENSDITANAEQGRGGRVSINSQAVFGTEFRQELTSESDITATSELGPEFSGTVEIRTPNIDPSQGFVEFPINFIEPTQLIATSCKTAQENTFVVTGRGGLPEAPTETLSGWVVWQDWRDLSVDLPSSVSSREVLEERKLNLENHSLSTQNNQSPIVEAQGWIIKGDGNVELVTNPPKMTAKSPWQTAGNCQMLHG
ncbi:MAG: S-layer family protein [Coleofasciculaceae cyanobacterium]